MTKEQEAWEKEFDEKFQTFLLDGMETQAVRTGVKDFIRQILTQREKEVLGRVTGWAKQEMETTVKVSETGWTSSSEPYRSLMEKYGNEKRQEVLSDISSYIQGRIEEVVK